MASMQACLQLQPMNDGICSLFLHGVDVSALLYASVCHLFVLVSVCLGLSGVMVQCSVLSSPD